jgi:hypothetical protein
MAGRFIAIVVVILVVVGLLGYVGIAQLTDKGSANNETDQSVDLVLNDLQKVQGKRVSVAGDVKTSLAPYAVLLGSSDATQVGLLVVAKRNVPKGVRLSTRVNAVGVARPFSLAEFRREHPAVTNKQLETSPLRRLNGQPALVEAEIAEQVPAS